MIGRILAIPFAIIVIAFAVSNRHDVGVSLDPLPYEFAVPLYLVALGVLIVGFAAGAVAAWLYGAKARRLARARKRRIDELERELAQSAPQDAGRGGPPASARAA